MKFKFIKQISILLLPAVILACSSLFPQIEDPHPTITPEPIIEDATALPNDSGIKGVQTYPSRPEYHNHVDVLPTPEGFLPPVFGEHFSAWQNCGIYDEPIELGSTLHSLEHGAVWLTYRSDLGKDQVTELQNLVRGHGYVLMSPYLPQKNDVVLTAWGVQLVIDSLPDERIAPFIAFYENGPQNPEPGAPCDGALGTPIK
ncbi:MAG: DUF3105 domain-containing protein [Anaerolineales bacterium]|nr:DUF3105 domain-containing protein [Anaerolineales bacterium]